MENWPELFSSWHNSAIFSGASDADAKVVRQAALTGGLAFFQIDLKKVSNKTGFLKKLARELYFPGYFGMNWDALSDCLTDMSWRPSGGYVLFFSNFNTFAEHCPRDAEVAGHIFDSCIDFWKQKEISFFIILSGVDAKGIQ